jgi:hypothetical protein
MRRIKIIINFSFRGLMAARVTNGEAEHRVAFVPPPSGLSAGAGGSMDGGSGPG